MARSRAACAVLAIALLGSVGWGWSASSRVAATYPATVTDTVDGDTVVVRFRDGRTETVRLLGIDTPETHHPTKPVGCYGPEASDYTHARAPRPARHTRARRRASRQVRTPACVHPARRQALQRRAAPLGLCAVLGHPAERRARKDDAVRRAGSARRGAGLVGGVPTELDDGLLRTQDKVSACRRIPVHPQQPPVSAARWVSSGDLRHSGNTSSDETGRVLRARGE